MCYYINYSAIAPATLCNKINTSTLNALCYWGEADSETYELTVIGWLPLTLEDCRIIEAILAPYV